MDRDWTDGAVASSGRYRRYLDYKRMAPAGKKNSATRRNSISAGGFNSSMAMLRGEGGDQLA
jgi:hypothetical protein